MKHPPSHSLVALFEALPLEVLFADAQNSPTFMSQSTNLPAKVSGPSLLR